MLALKNLFRSFLKRKKPWFMMMSNGVTDEGLVHLEMGWNEAFIKHIRSIGFIGHNDEESVQQFFMSFTRHQVMADDAPVNSEAHPFLNEMSGNMVKR